MNMFAETLKEAEDVVAGRQPATRRVCYKLAEELRSGAEYWDDHLKWLVHQLEVAAEDGRK